MTYELIEYHKSGSGNYILRIKHTMGWPKWIARLFRLEEDRWFRTYIGSGTVWWSWPKWERLPSCKEAKLSEIYARIQYEESSS